MAAKRIILRGNSGSGKTTVARRLFGPAIYAYYYDIPFQETLRRHQTKPNRGDFGREEMARWWREKDYIGWIPEKRLTADVGPEEAEEQIYQDVTAE